MGVGGWRGGVVTVRVSVIDCCAVFDCMFVFITKAFMSLVIYLSVCMFGFVNLLLAPPH